MASKRDGLDWSPKLRADLLVDEDLDNGLAVLRDPVSKRVHRLSSVATFIARHLDGEHALSELLESMQAQGLDIDAEKLLAFVRALDDQTLLLIRVR